MPKIILSHPYSGALYGFFSDGIGGAQSHTRRAQNNSYYRTLYGSNYDKYVDLSLTFMVLFDEVLMAPADTHMPETEMRGQLGFRVDWEDFARFQSTASDFVKALCVHPTITSHLSETMRLPPNTWETVMTSVVYELGLATQHGAQILCGPGRHVLIDLIDEISPSTLRPAVASQGQAEFVKSYSELSGLAMKPRSINELAHLKTEPLVRRYADSFLASIDGSRASRVQVARLMRDTLSNRSVMTTVSGVFKWGGSLFRTVGVPIVGAVLEGAHLVTQPSPNWVEFKGAIESAIGDKQLQDTIDAVLRESGNASDASR